MKIALLFPGTGSAYTGMFKSLYEQQPVVRQTFAEASDALDMDMRAICFEGDMDTISRLAYAHVATIVCSVAAFRHHVQETACAPAFAAGHSVGEFAALVASGVLRFDEALRAVWVRAKLLEEAARETDAVLLAIKHLPPDQVQHLCRETSDHDLFATIACYNGPDQVVVTAHRSVVEPLSILLTAQGAEVIDLNVNVPFHSPLLHVAANRLRQHLEGLQFAPPAWPAVSNVTARPHGHGADDLIDGLTVQLTCPVRWHESIAYLQSQGVSDALELGPKAVLKRLNQQIARNIRAYASDLADDLAAFNEQRSRAPGYVATCLAIAVSTRNHNPESRDYAEQVARPYASLRRIYDQSEQLGRAPTDAERNEALTALCRILDYKQVPGPVYEARLSQVEQAAPKRTSP